ncbi:hypothetical protein ACH5RR_024131 [Cinchona calisaya]|uniref:Membrane-associated kinase regulator 6 n=1 Tax=Cinchona calisaya TaxID=153742 RepID=A0ABD2ZCN0_9GENT
MENSQSLATDSFSYSWLINPRKPSFDELLESLRPSLDISSEIETVPIFHHHHHLNKNLKDDHQDFDFNFTPGCRSFIALADADEIFSQGCIKPVSPNFRDRTRMLASTSLPATPISISSVSCSRTLSASSAYRSQYYSSKKGTKSANKVLRKCFSLLRPFCQGFGCSRKSIRVDDLDRKVLEVRTSRSNSQQASPDRRTANYSAGNLATTMQTSNTVDVCKGQQNQDVKSWSNSPQASPPRSPPPLYTDASCDIESSIHEAILHCKRSFAN